MNAATLLLVAALAMGSWATDNAVAGTQQTIGLSTQVQSFGTETATIPRVLPYQGRLTDADGTPVADGLYAIRFRLYARPDGGTHFWEETQNVTARDGMFSVLLGSVTPITERGEGRGTGAETAYLGMAVEGDAEMTPRLRIAGTASTAELGTGSSPRGGTDADDAWVRIGSDSVLYTIRRLGIVRGGSSNVLYGTYGYTQTIFGSSCTTGANGANVGNIAIGGGYGNRAWAPFTAVCGGRNNKAGDAATDTSAIVVGGYGNRAIDRFSAVIGGQNNTASGLYSVIPGGYGNTCAGDYGMVGGNGASTGAAADLTFAFGENVSTTTPRAVVFYHSGGATKLGVGVQNPTVNVDVAGTGRFNSKLVAAAGFKADSAVADSEWATKGYVNTYGGGNDSDWVRVGTDSVLYTAHRLGVARGGSANALLGTDPHTYVNFGVECTTGTAGLQTTGIAVGGGVRHRALREYSTVAGGFYNSATARYAVIGGGDNNRADGDAATIAGGHDNTASGYGSFVGGGGITGLWPSGNSASGHYSAIVGGTRNQASANYAFIGSGNYDSARAAYSAAVSGWSNRAAATAADTAAVVVGGRNNQALGKYSFVGGGKDNAATDYGATVAGGERDSAGGYYSTVGGGWNNRAGYNYSTVGGGANSSADNYGATVGGGWDNHATGWGATVSGGGIVNLSPSGNTASGNYSTIAGGVFNRALANYATVGGGYYDSAVALYSAALSGSNNKAGLNSYDTAALICGGARNRARSYFSAVLGGADNIVAGAYGTVGGGKGDTVTNNYGVVVGGTGNYNSGSAGFIGSGVDNRVTAIDGVIAGGYDNTVTASYSAIGGGYRNSIAGNDGAIAGGYYNVIASGYYNAIPGGYRDSIYSDYSFATNNQSTVPAGYDNAAAFNGQTVTASNQTRVGALSKASGTFTIDHPLDPAGTILNHYFIEGPEMRNIYEGVAVLDASGRAEVRLPGYFDALNRNPHIQLTGVGTFEVCVAEEVADNQFAIGGKPGTKVFWQVTGERRDVSAEATRRMMPVEQPKSGGLAGRMLDDEFLSGCMDQLVREGKASGIDFRTAVGRQRYEKMKQRTEELLED